MCTQGEVYYITLHAQRRDRELVAMESRENVIYHSNLI